MKKIMPLIEELHKQHSLDTVFLFGSQKENTEIDVRRDVDLAFIFQGEFLLLPRRQKVQNLMNRSGYKCHIQVFSRKQYELLLKFAPKVPKEQDVWGPGKGSRNSAYQISLGKKIFGGKK